MTDPEKTRASKTPEVVPAEKLAAAAELIRSHAQYQSNKCELAKSLLRSVVQKAVRWNYHFAIVIRSHY